MVLAKRRPMHWGRFCPHVPSNRTAPPAVLVDACPAQWRPERAPRRATMHRTLLLSAVGLALLWPSARHWRIDRATSGALPSSGWRVELGCSLLYLVALALLTLGWRYAMRTTARLRTVVSAGAFVHGLALLLPPFLSLDPLCYAAIGRTMTQHRSPYLPLVVTLQPGDPFLARLPITWQQQGSAYWPTFNALAWLISRLGGADLTLQLHLYQFCGLACMVATAALVGRAVAVTHPHAAGHAAAMILFSPLAILEGTLNPHNDALLAVSVALFAWATSRGRARLGLAVLSTALTVKASALLLWSFGIAQLAGRTSRAQPSGRRPAVFMLVGALVLVLAGLVTTPRLPGLRLVFALVGDAHSMPHCTRSFECVPRALLAWVLNLPQTAWIVGLTVRLTAVLWLAWSGWQAALHRTGTLQWAATSLFGYYLFLHGFMQSWYLLSLLPLMPFADRRLFSAMETFAVSTLVYYALRLPLQNLSTNIEIGALELTEGVIVLVPPTLVLVVNFLGGRDARAPTHAAAPFALYADSVGRSLDAPGRNQ